MGYQMTCLSRYYRFFQQKLQSPPASCPNDGNMFGRGYQDSSTISSCFERESFKCMSDYDSPLRHFLDRSMPLHKASVIESFRLDLAFAGCKPEDIKVWIFIAV